MGVWQLTNLLIPITRQVLRLLAVLFHTCVTHFHWWLQQLSHLQLPRWQWKRARLRPFSSLCSSTWTGTPSSSCLYSDTITNFGSSRKENRMNKSIPFVSKYIIGRKCWGMFTLHQGCLQVKEKWRQFSPLSLCKVPLPHKNSPWQLHPTKSLH